METISPQQVMSAIEWTIFWSLLWGTAGTIIGAKKGRPVRGFLLSLLCGPLGVLLVILDKGNRIECSFCMEKIHKDASVCPHCRREIYRNTYFEEQEAASRKRAGIAAIIILIALASIAFLVLIRETKSNYFARSRSTSTETASEAKTRRWITRKQFDQLRDDMSYYEVVKILGFRGELVSETRISGREASDVLYRWVNPDGSMVIISFRRVSTAIDDEHGIGLLAKSISSVGLAE